MKGPVEKDVMNLNLYRCSLYIDGRRLTIYMSEANYEALMYDGIFIRDGNEKDSAGVINTTNIFEEKLS